MADMVSREEYEKLLEENKRLREQLDYLMRKMFGKSSEKTELTQEGQTSLFDDDGGSPVNKIDNLNRDFFVLCHD